MENWSTKKRLAILTAFFAAQMFGLALANAVVIRQLQLNLENTLAEDAPTGRSLAQIHLAQIDVRNSAFDTMVAAQSHDRTRAKQTREKLDGLRTEIFAALADLKTKPTSPKFQELLKTIETDFQWYLALADDLVRTSSEGTRALQTRWKAFEVQLASLESSTRQLRGIYESDNRNHVESTLETAEGASKIALLALLVVTLSGATLIWLNHTGGRTNQPPSKNLSGGGPTQPLNALTQHGSLAGERDGFAMVAETVANLASKSGNAAKEISQLLEESLQMVKTISAQSPDGWSRELEETLLALQSLNRATEATAVATSSYEKASEALAAQSQALRESAQKLQMAIAGADKTSRPSTA